MTLSLTSLARKDRQRAGPGIRCLRRLRRPPVQSGMTLMEMMMFSAIGIVVIITMVGLLTQGSKLLGIGRRASGTQGALRQLLETLAEDAAELVSLENNGAPYDSAGGGTFSFVIRSSRNEGGYGGPAGLRKVEDKLEGTGELKDCVRTVTEVGGGGATVTHKVATDAITLLKIWPMAVVRSTAGGPRYQVTAANAAGADDPGSTVACLVVDVSAGQGVGDQVTDLENQPVTAIVTKLWCRNRIAELSRGALQ